MRDGHGRDIDQMWRSLDSPAWQWERGTVEATASGLFGDKYLQAVRAQFGASPSGARTVYTITTAGLELDH